MIVINRNWLRTIGVPQEVEFALEEPRGLMLSNLYTFGQGLLRGRYYSALLQEPTPRVLILVGMRDNHEDTRAHVSIVVELCTSNGTWRLPIESERRTLLEYLQTIDHPTAHVVIAALVELATPGPMSAA